MAKELKEQSENFKEYRLVEEKIKEKQADWLGVWLKKFSEKGTWNLARYRDEKNDWL